MGKAASDDLVGLYSPVGTNPRGKGPSGWTGIGGAGSDGLSASVGIRKSAMEASLSRRNDVGLDCRNRIVLFSQTVQIATHTALTGGWIFISGTVVTDAILRRRCSLGGFKALGEPEELEVVRGRL